jgi:anti-sigma factor RsiW
MAEPLNPWPGVPYALDCQTVVDQADSWIDGELESSAREKVELHVATCLGCTAYVANLRATVTALGTLDTEAPSVSIREALMERFRRHTA